jgi:hypothetical protein
LYYSHGKAFKRSVGFIQYGAGQAPGRIQHDVTHPTIQYLKFILAGKQFAYPGFNGLFLNVVYNIGPGAFIDTVDQFTAVYNKLSQPVSGWENKIVVQN